MDFSKRASAIGIIPARFGASRFPGKLLAPIFGRTVIERTYERAMKAGRLDALVVVCDDERIASCIEGIGGRAFMTSPHCPTGTDRIVEAVKRYPELASFDIVVNIQGDGPCIDPAAIDSVISALEQDASEVMATCVVPIHDEHELNNPSVVKCIFSQSGHALYFSRACIPARRANMPGGHWKHVGLYAFRKSFLLTYGELQETPLQRAEDLEQLKAIEWGFPIKIVKTTGSSPHVDVPEDIQKVERWLCNQNISL